MLADIPKLWRPRQRQTGCSDPVNSEAVGGVRSLNCATPGTASELISEALEGCALCRAVRADA
eukprot:2827413-Alexandrium_andersonii.AAC.1